MSTPTLEAAAAQCRQVLSQSPAHDLVVVAFREAATHSPLQPHRVFVCGETGGDGDSDSGDSTCIVEDTHDAAAGSDLLTALCGLMKHHGPPGALAALAAQQAREGRVRERLVKEKAGAIMKRLRVALDSLTDESDLRFAASVIYESMPSLYDTAYPQSKNTVQAAPPLARMESRYHIRMDTGSPGHHEETGPVADHEIADLHQRYVGARYDRLGREVRGEAGLAQEDDYPDMQYYWAREYYRIHERMATAGSATTNLETLLELSNLTSSFTHAARLYAQIIAYERGLRNEDKSIQPVDAGGIAGGDKYIAGEIFFKFSVDSSGIYGGSDLTAAKAARHDLRNINILNQSPAPAVRVPLACIVDCNGMSILALSRVPIEGTGSLVYGSADGARTVHDSDPEARGHMERVGQWLNLKPHVVAGKTMHLCGDVEVHRGPLRQGGTHAYYILDVARLLPCEPPPATGVRGDSPAGVFLTRLLRPELVSKAAAPLCSDAFSAFDDSPREEALRHNRDVEGSFTALFEQHIPMLAEFMDTLDSTTDLHPAHLMHSYGANVRFLKVLYGCLQSDHWRQVVLTEMAARAAKEIVLRLLNRHSKVLQGLAVNHTFVSLVQKFLRDVLVDSKENMWSLITRVVAAKFYRGPDVSKAIGRRGEGVDARLLYVRLQEMIGIDDMHGTDSEIASRPEAGDISTRIRRIRHVGLVIHGLEIAEVAAVVPTLRMAQEESDKARRLNLLNALSATINWTPRLLSKLGLVIPEMLLARAELMVDHQRNTMECIVALKDAMVAFHKIQGDTLDDHAEPEVVGVWTEWFDKENEVSRMVVKETYRQYGGVNDITHRSMRFREDRLREQRHILGPHNVRTPDGMDNHTLMHDDRFETDINNFLRWLWTLVDWSTLWDDGKDKELLHMLDSPSIDIQSMGTRALWWVTINGNPPVAADSLRDLYTNKVEPIYANIHRVIRAPRGPKEFPMLTVFEGRPWNGMTTSLMMELGIDKWAGFLVHDLTKEWYDCYLTPIFTNSVSIGSMSGPASHAACAFMSELVMIFMRTRSAALEYAVPLSEWVCLITPEGQNPAIRSVMRAAQIYNRWCAGGTNSDEGSRRELLADARALVTEPRTYHGMIVLTLVQLAEVIVSLGDEQGLEECLEKIRAERAIFRGNMFMENEVKALEAQRMVLAGAPMEAVPLLEEAAADARSKHLELADLRITTALIRVLDSLIRDVPSTSADGGSLRAKLRDQCDHLDGVVAGCMAPRRSHVIRASMLVLEGSRLSRQIRDYLASA